MKRINGTSKVGTKPIGCYVLVKEPSRIELIMKCIELLFNGRDKLGIEFRGAVYSEDKKPISKLCTNKILGLFHYHKMNLNQDQYLENQGLLYKYFSHDTKIRANGLLYGDFFRSRQKSRILYYSLEERDFFGKVLFKLQDQGIAGEFIEYKGIGRV